MNGYNTSENVQAGTVVHAALMNAIAQRREIGIQATVYFCGRLVLNVGAGMADPESQRPVREDTLFNMFSVGKAVTATAVHIQAERKLVEYDRPVADYWPEFGANGKGAITVRHVLIHRSGVPQMPAGMTIERLGDWEDMCRGIAALSPLFPTGERAAYQAMTYGWILGEIVRRTDLRKRDFNRFVQDEICRPLGISDMWFGIPDSAEARVATLFNANADDPAPPDNPWRDAGMPPAVRLIPQVYERPSVRRACIPAVGVISNAPSMARFWAMLAGGGELDGVRLLSQACVEDFSTPRPRNDEPDPVMYGGAVPISHGGFWLGGKSPRACSLKGYPRAIWHPGAGGTIAWADSGTGLAVAIAHNRMYNAPKCELDPMVAVASAIRSSLGLHD